MKDIESKEDIALVVSQFYEKLLTDETIGHFFTEVITLDLQQHLPVIISFWDSMLLGANTYKGNPMTRHFELNSRSTMERTHFDRWLQIWEETINEYFAGKVADEAIARSRSIALLMHHKMSLVNNKN
jgi:hemoglobin